MHRVIISDTSCLIILRNIGELELLHRLYGTVYITPEVSAEFSQELPAWFVVEAPVSTINQSMFELQVDRGEASAIALAIEKEDVLLILDDRKARKFAASLQLKFIGTMGLLQAAKRQHIVPAIRPLVDKILQTNFHIGSGLIAKLLSANGEI